MKNLIGQTIRVLVTGADRKPGFLKGLTEGKINVRFPANQMNLVDLFVDVGVTGSNGLSLEGKMAPIRITALAGE